MQGGWKSFAAAMELPATHPTTRCSTIRQESKLHRGGNHPPGPQPRMYGVAPKPGPRLASIHFAKFDGVRNGELLLLRSLWKRRVCGNPHPRRSILRPGTSPVWSVHGEYMFRTVLARVNGARQGAIEPVRKAGWTASARDRVLPCTTPNGSCAVGSAMTRRTCRPKTPCALAEKTQSTSTPPARH